MSALKNIVIWIGLLSSLSLLVLSCDKREPTSSKKDYSVTINVAESSSYAGFNDSIEVVALLREGDTPVADAMILFITMPTDSSDETGYFYPVENNTNSQGKVTTYFFDNDIVADHAISAKYEEIIASDTVTVSPLSGNIGSLGLVISPNPLVFPTDYDGSTQTVAVTASVNDADGVLIKGAVVRFQNLTPAIGSLVSGSSITNNLGIAETTYLISTEQTGSAIISGIIDTLVATDTLYIVNSEQVSGLSNIATMSTWMNTGEILVDNINVAVSDTLYAQVTNESGGPVSNIPVLFKLLDTSYGYLSQTLVYTDSTGGMASSIFNLDPSSLPVGEDDFQIDFELSILNSDEFVDTLSVVIHLDENLFTPEYNVAEFHFYPNSASHNHILGDESELVVIAKNNAGVGICNVPIRFELQQSRSSYGEINTALSYTTCEAESDTSSESHQNGTTSVIYTNIEGTGSDVLRAFILDPNNSSIVLYEDEITVNNVTQLEIDLQNVESMNVWSGSPSIFVSDIQHAYSDTIYASALNASGAVLPGIPFEFHLADPSQGQLSHSFPISDEDGIAKTVFTSIPGLIGTIVSISVGIPETAVQSENVDITFVDPVDFVSEMDTWMNTGVILVDNINVAVSDTLYAQVTNESGGPVSNIPVLFKLLDTSYGYLSQTLVYTDSTGGMASSIFNLDPSSLPVGEDDFQIDFELSILNSDEFVDTLSVVIHLDENLFTPEYNVAEFHFYPNSASHNHILGDESELVVIAKNNAGVGICNVPIRFELQQSRSSYGEINTALSYTTCEAESDTSSESHQNGTTSVIYTNIEGTGSDVLRAFILDPNNSSIVLYEDEITINNNSTSGYTLEDVESMNAWLSTTSIYMIDADSSFSDTLYATALNVNGGSMMGIPFEFGLTNPTLGQLSSSHAESDSTGIARSIFTTVPGVTDTTITFTISIPGRPDISERILVLTLIDDAPECPGCEPALTLTANPMTLPDEDTGATTSTITAHMVDSLGMAPDPNTIVEFEAIQLNEEDEWVSVGSITPYTFFDADGYAYVEFSMGNSAGLASIVGRSGGLTDTTHVVMNSTAASYIEIIQPIPNEIMVQGGGGVESTLIMAEIKDGNGNLVSDPYLVEFEITQPSPTGVHLNGNVGVILEEVTSANGIATVTLNAGTQPGSVRMRATLSDLNGSYISMAETVPVTIVTGPPAYGEINFSYVEITPIGGGLYDVPISVHLWDMYSNPVSDSTNVYIKLLENALPYDEAAPYLEGDKVWWGTSAPDSLVYKCLQPSFGNEPSNTEYWILAQQPAAIIGEAKTGMPSPNGDYYPGVAWSTLRYSSAKMFAQVVIFAQTFDSNGEYLIIDSRDNHNNEATIMPYQPGIISVSASIQFWDFNGGGDFTDDITIVATISDYYSYPIDNGRLQLVAAQAEILTVDGPDGGVGGDLSIGLSNAQGQVTWTIRYHKSVCPVQTQDPVTYADFISTVIVQLLDPLQTSSDPIDITLINSAIE
ncbi:MAG: hypothetical protein H8E64_04695 [Candidatus Marinimicrobia bacterium]|nr:hypothetical protein [Candidatus Neomarinimicrobiota bacterium]